MDNVMLWLEVGLFILVLVGFPLYAAVLQYPRQKESAKLDLRAFNLPNGSIRAMLALLIVGSFLIFLMFGGAVAGLNDHFAQIVTAFATLSGSVIGFYFGARVGQPAPNQQPPTDSVQ